MSTENPTELEQAIAALPEGAVKYESVFVPFSKSRNAKDKNLSLNWVVTINGETFDYMAGIGHISNEEIRRAAMKSGWTINEKATITEWAEGRYMSLNGSALGMSRPFDKCTIESQKQAPPNLADVVYCLCADMGALDAKFEDWAGDYGYDTDSREAERIYNACRENSYKLVRALGASLVEELRRKEH